MAKQLMFELRGDLDAIARQSRNAPVRSEEDKARAAGRSAKLLRLLTIEPIRWWSTGELVTAIGHRFSTNIQSLRDRGYVIEKRGRDDGGFEYRFIAFNARVAINEHHANAYYGTAHWRAIAAHRRQVDGNRCCMCKSTENLHVHHWRYDLFNERLTDLMTLCRDCHQRIHESDGIAIAFPKFVDIELARRLQKDTGGQSQ